MPKFRYILNWTLTSEHEVEADDLKSSEDVFYEELEAGNLTMSKARDVKVAVDEIKPIEEDEENNENVEKQ